jgi:prophage tail gpP-like protein
MADFRLIVGGCNINVDTFRANRSIDSMSDVFTATFAWTPGLDPLIDQALKLYSYSPFTLELFGELIQKGEVTDITNGLIAEGGRTKTIVGYSSTIVLVDSQLPLDMRQWSGAYMADIATQIAGKFGLTSSVATGARGTLFDIIDHNITETAGKFIDRIAFQSSLLATNDRNGQLIFYDAKTLGRMPTVGTIREGIEISQEFSITGSGRERWGMYIAVGESGDADDIQSTALDSAVTTRRLNIFTADDIPLGSAASIAKWKRSKQITKALSISLPLTGWKNPQGDVWRPGMMVTVVSDTLELGNGFTFLVRETEHVFDSQGERCTLKVVPYQAYTGDDIPSNLWR